jgi:hypothetical protein
MSKNMRIHERKAPRFILTQPNPQSSNSKTMCTATLYRNHDCGHRYLALDTPCAPGMNLLTCPMFQPGATTRTSRFPPFLDRQAPRHSCPRCDKKGNYDFEFLRAVQARRYGKRIGMGPARSDPGIDIPCVGLCIVRGLFREVGSLHKAYVDQPC